ncbi:akirin-2-like isoform X2 [Xenia sp. Carnegie-2017]|uniref:akirin-2-like isoform X2 n=1 Tax=Xenia sp. Carnegie-2017 TaxID=2897299 RepID=UPI001F03893A|nr:akirin-2-like isoform X2 [Xenia sp. Carnegie-2017]
MACATLKRSYEFDPVLSPQQQPCQKRRRYMTVKSNPTSSVKDKSKFFEATPNLTSEIAQNVEQEWRRYQKRKRLAVLSPSSSTDVQHSLPSVVTQPASTITASSSDSKPIFTLKQVQIICERMLKEREETLREEYDKVLNQKLSENMKTVGIVLMNYLLVYLICFHFKMYHKILLKEILTGSTFFWWDKQMSSLIMYIKIYITDLTICEK